MRWLKRTTQTNTDPLASHATRLWLSHAALVAESMARAFWPVWSLAFFVLTLLAFDVPSALPPGWAFWGLIGAGIVALGLVIQGILRLKWPTKSAALHRLDGPHRPLASLTDSPVNDHNPATAAVWKAHQARMREAAQALRVKTPDLNLAQNDPWALRLMALTALIVAVLFARGHWFDARNLGPNGASAAVATGPSFEAWATPPAYTGLPTLYLTERGSEDRLLLPQGSEITLRAYGDTFTLDQTVTAAPVELVAAAEGVFDARFTVNTAGQITLRQADDILAAWPLIITPDTAPIIDFDGDVILGTGGTTEIPYIASDDFELAKVEAIIALDFGALDRRHGLIPDPMPRDAIEVTIPLPLRAGSEVMDTFVQDFGTHPFANLPVQITLIATDGAGHIGRSAPLATTLPRRGFYDPLARAVIELRRDLLWAPDANAERSSQLLRAITYSPEDMDLASNTYLALRRVLTVLDTKRDDGSLRADLDELAQQMWSVALAIEDGDLADAAAALRRAEERLSQALEDSAPDSEVADLMQDLRDAMRDYMQDLSEQAQRDGEQQQSAEDGESLEFSQQDIQDLMDRIQELSEAGEKEEAQRLLDQLAQMMEDMQMSQNQQGSGGEGEDGQSAEGGSPQEGVQDMLRQQQELADRAFEEMQRQFREGQQDPSKNQSDGDGESLDDLAETQDALREMLDNMGEDMAGEAGREALEQAERDMAAARDALNDDNGRDALDSQAQAMDNLREGMRAMDDADAQRAEAARTQGDAPTESNEDGTPRDPLGRATAGGRLSEGEGEMLSDEGGVDAARELMDEIRRRAAEQDRPGDVRNYLERLLERF